MRALLLLFGVDLMEELHIYQCASPWETRRRVHQQQYLCSHFLALAAWENACLPRP